MFMYYVLLCVYVLCIIYVSIIMYDVCIYGQICMNLYPEEGISIMHAESRSTYYFLYMDIES